MKRYLATLAMVTGVLLLLFFVAEPWSIPVLSDPVAWLRRDDLIAAGMGIGLLVVDVVLPVPSSLVMIALGSAYGAFFTCAIGPSD